MGTKVRLALAASVSFAALAAGSSSQAALQSARDWLTGFSGQIASGNYTSAREDLNRLAEVCPGFEGLMVHTGRTITNANLSGLLSDIDSGASTQDAVVSALQTVLNDAAWIRFVCDDAQVASVDLDTGEFFPIGSAG